MNVWTRVRGIAREQLGLELDAASIRPLEVALDAQGLDSAGREAFVSRLEKVGSEDEAFRTLVRNVTNGQTYFMRDSAQLSSLEAFFKLRAASSGQAVHVWCAGCSTGEEAYTVSMLGRRAGVSLRIVATDVNRDALERAREGEYGEWALRHVEAAERLTSFSATRRGFRVNDPIRSQVTFRHHNLATDGPYPSPAAHQSWDAILCRNVLIYFAAEARAKVIAGFDSVLASDGALLLSSAESVRGLGTRLRPRYLGGGYVLSPAANRTSLAPGLLPRINTGQPPYRTLLSDRPPSITPRLSVTDGLLSRPSATDGLRSRSASAAKYWMDLGNDWLRQHEFEQALDAYAQANRLEVVSFEPYLLMAIVRLKRGELEEARNALRSALFLEPRAWSAEYLLAGVLTREGKTSEATTAFDRALALLEDGPTLIKHVSDCSGIEPLCYTLDEALALCHKRRGSVRVKVRT